VRAQTETGVAAETNIMYGKFFVLFAMMATGYILRRIRFLDDRMNDGLNRFIVYFAFPCLLVKNIAALEIRGETAVQFLLMLGLTLATMAAGAVLTHIYTKLRHIPPEQGAVAELAMSTPNDGFMGFPVTLIFFGQPGLLMMMAHNLGLNIYFFTYGIFTLRRDNAVHVRLTPWQALVRVLRILVNPNLVAVYLGFALGALRVPLDNAAGEYLGYMGAVATPMAMVFIGSSLVGSNPAEIFRSRLVWGGTVFKLVLLPLAAAAIVWLLPVPTLIKACVILGACFPTAATAPMLAQQEEKDEAPASRILFVTTVLSMATIPLSVHLIRMILPV
jgi:predicted permease